VKFGDPITVGFGNFEEQVLRAGGVWKILKSK
jgi:hypothetical protein